MPVLNAVSLFLRSILKMKSAPLKPALKLKNLVMKNLVALLASASMMLPIATVASPLTIGYGDYPGYTAWQVAIEKGWFKEEGVDVKFVWFDYSASLDAFATGKIDAVGLANGDALILGATGAHNVMYLVTDYSNGNDMVIAKKGINSLKDLKGKKVAVEVGVVDHLLLITALEKAGMSESDVILVNAKTNELPKVLASKDIAAIAVWQPSAGQALKEVPGSHVLYTSAEKPGLLYDAVTVNPNSLMSRKADWAKVMKVWYRVVDYINNPATQADAVKIMATRVSLTPQEYLPLLKGTKLLSLPEAKKAMQKTADFSSLYGSSKNADQFNLKNGLYKESQNVDKYINSTFTTQMKP